MPEFDLQNFLPFRLSRLSFEVSNKMAEIYSERFDISIPEWRILATLAARKQCTAQAIVASTRTHKSTISRAVARLTKNGWIEQISSKDDKRKHVLQLTIEGKSKFSKLMPLVRIFEEELHAKMSNVDMDKLLEGINALERIFELGMERDQKHFDL